MNEMLLKVDVVSGATCSDSDCEQFGADAHKCEGCLGPNDHSATWTITMDDVAVVFVCSDGLQAYVEQLKGEGWTTYSIDENGEVRSDGEWRGSVHEMADGTWEADISAGNAPPVARFASRDEALAFLVG